MSSIASNIRKITRLIDDIPELWNPKAEFLKKFYNLLLKHIRVK
jgi:hypothetical protein